MSIDKTNLDILKNLADKGNFDDPRMKLFLDAVASEMPTNLIEESKARVLKNMELHRIASELIEDEVSKYREDLYLFSKKVASREMENDIITKAHVIKARDFFWRKKNKYDFADGYLAIGGLLAGAGFVHVLDLILKSDQIPPMQASPLLIILGIIGGFLLGMGIIAKAKQ